MRVAFGLGAGPVPDRFLVGLAVLSLLSEAAGERPLVCVVDDEQWLDRASAQVLGFVARRLAAEPVGLVFAARLPGDELTGLPELAVEGLPEGDARALLASVLAGPLDARVRDQMVAETRGNPLALLELPRGLTSAELAGGFGPPATVPLLGRIEESFRRRIEDLPKESRLLMLIVAAEPTGDSSLVWRAAGRLGIGVQAAAPAAEAGLVEFAAQVRFRHPLVRSTAYRSASAQDLQEVHRALAEATDPAADPDRRAWHRAQATAVPDEDVAVELERSAGRAQARGGLAAAAAFGERAAILTPDPVRRAQRLLAAARAKRDAGALDAALGLLVAVEAGPLGQLQTAEVEHMRGQIALDQRRGSDAARLLLSAARRLEPLNAARAREAYLEALWEAAMWAGDLDIPGGARAAAEAALGAPPGPDPPRVADVLLDAFARRLTEGHAAAAPALARALELVLALDFGTDETGRWLWLAGGRISQIIALELWDAEAWHALATRQAQFARGAGALVHLQFALNYLARANLVAGDLATAALMIEEDRLIAEATGNPPVAHNAMMLAAWRGREREASELIEASAQEATARGLGRLVSFAAYASAVLHNGLGRHDAACHAARQAFDCDQLGYGPLVIPELAEAAARTGDVALVAAAYPERLRSLVVGSGAAAVPLELGGLLKDWVEAPDPEEFGQADPRQLVASALAGLERYMLPDSVREDYLTGYQGNRFAGSMRYIRAYPAELPLLAGLLPQIRTPVQIIAGAHDKVVPPANAEFLHQRLPHSKLDIVDAGHFTWEDAAAEYAALITSWWDGGYKATSENTRKSLNSQNGGKSRMS